MKKFTNYAPGARGIRTEDGLVMIEPGQSVEIDPKTIVGNLPDLGKKSDAKEDGPDAGDFDVLSAQVADLTKQVEALEGDKAKLEAANADLTKQVEALTKPADGKK